MKLLALFTALSIGLSGQAQNDAEPEAIYLSRQTSIDLTAGTSGLEITEHHREQKKFLRNFSKHTREAVYYSDFDPLLDIKAQTVAPSARGDFKSTNVSAFETEDVMQPGIFYGGLKRRLFVYTVSTAGSVGMLEYNKKIIDPHFIGSFYFDEDIPVSRSTYVVSTRGNVKIGWKIFGSHTDRISFNKTTGANGLTVFTWSLENVPAYTQDEDAPSRSWFAPHIVVYVESFARKDGKEESVLTNVDDLYRWYAHMVRLMPSNENPAALKDLVAEITRGASTDEEKTRNIFQWVQQNIRYVAFEDGMAGFVPRPAYDVYKKKYGDCKDMANLLKDLLNIAGVPAYHAWIGTRSKPYSYSQLPTAVVCNHMICAAKISSGYIFLDATNPFLSFGKPSSMIQGKEALIGKSAEAYEIVVIPTVDRKENVRADSVTFRLSDNGVNGTVSSTLTGFTKDKLEFAQIRAKLDRDTEYIRDFFKIGGDDISIQHVTTTGLAHQDQPANTKFDFSQPGYARRVADRIYINLHLYKATPGKKIDVAAREKLLERDFLGEERLVSRLEIPNGFAPLSIPADQERSWPEFGFSIRYHKEAGHIVMEKTVWYNFLYLAPEKFGDWNTFLDILGSLQQQSITLARQ